MYKPWPHTDRKGWVMKYFLEDFAEVQSEETFYFVTPSYIELIKTVVNPSSISRTYIWLVQDYTFFICTCWEHQFDPWMQLLIERPGGINWFRTLSETYPTAGRLLTNAHTERYSDGVLVNLPDPDDGERKWFIGTVVGNVHLESEDQLQTFLLSDRMMDSYLRVWMPTFELLDELQTRNIPTSRKLKDMGVSFFKGFSEGIETSGIWLDRVSVLIGR